MNLIQHISPKEKENIEAVSPALERVKSRLGVAREKGSEVGSDAFVSLPFDPDSLARAREVLKKRGLLGASRVVLVGMGGSQLGARALASALGSAKLVSVETINKELLKRICEDLPEDAVLVVASKSGTTAETLAAAEFMRSRLPRLQDRMICLTKEGSPLWRDAERAGILAFPVPAEVEGRFSVFSLMGIVPLLLLGEDTEEVLRGAREETEAFLQGSSSASRSAALRFLHTLEGRTAHVSFFFQDSLLDLGRWERQLVAESLGKEEKGVLPIISGPADLHSILQLYLGGPDSFFFTFVRTGTRERDSAFSSPLFTQARAAAPQMGLGELADRIEASVVESFQEEGRPFQEMNFASVLPAELGQAMQFHMIETVLLAELLEVNPYGQEKVEGYKKIARR